MRVDNLTMAKKRRIRVLSVVGTRPNFMKIAPIAHTIASEGDLEHVLVHTGQHYDDAMSGVFLDELGLPEPDVYLGIGSGTHTAQTARVVTELEPVLRQLEPDAVLVPGDVNSTLAAALTAKQSGFVVGHVEAGLRSFDRTMPEELNRVLTDQISDLPFIHSPEAREHLISERRPANAIHDVGNTMIDSLVRLRPAIGARDIPRALGLSDGAYILVTLHRPALVDGIRLGDALRAVGELAESFEVIFPVHPRTRAQINALDGPNLRHPRLRLMDPLGYVEFVGLMAGAAGVLTDSGGVQEETTFLGVPCFTLRENTERPITVTLGTNTLRGLDPAKITDIPPQVTNRNGRRCG